MHTLCLLTLLVCGSLGDIGIPFPPDFYWDEPNALDAYVHYDDGFFQWQEVGTPIHFDNWGVTVYLINMTSQKWMDEEYVDRPYWYHYMGIAVPDDLSEITHFDTGFLYIDGGSNNDDLPTKLDPLVDLCAELTHTTGSITGFMHHVPNQRLHFYNDPTFKSRGEDWIIAWTWYSYMNDPKYFQDPKVILRLPMTKAAKRGLDTMHEFALLRLGNVNLQKFTISGASKRGWTAWSLAATDQRVIAVVPVVMSMLNWTMGMDMHQQSLDGGWSFAMRPYFDEGLTHQINDPTFVFGVLDYEDPWRYRSRLAEIPKFSIAGTGDEFFFPTDFLGWYSEMEGQQHLLMIPNAEHTLAPWYPQIVRSTITFYRSILEGFALPVIDYAFHTTDTYGEVVMESNVAPVNVSGYWEYTLITENKRDFRLITGYPDAGIHPVRFLEEPVVHLGENRFLFRVQNPNPPPSPGERDRRWAALFIKATFDVYPDAPMMELSTPVLFTPPTFPIDACTTPDSCYGYLC